MTTNQSEDEGLREQLVEGVNQLCNIFEASILGAEVTDAQYQESCTNYVDGLMALISQKILEAEQIGAFMAASAILIEMSPLMVHRLERDFPSMSAEVIGSTFQKIKEQMKPYQDARTLTQGIKEEES